MTRRANEVTREESKQTGAMQQNQVTRQIGTETILHAAKAAKQKQHCGGATRNARPSIQTIGCECNTIAKDAAAK